MVAFTCPVAWESDAMNFLIRLPRRGEGAEVAAMAFELWPEEGRSAFSHQLGAFRRHVCGGRRGALFVAEGDGALVGFVAVGVRPWSDAGESSPIPHVEGWFVKRAWRRRGVGKALLKAAEDWARKQGFTELGSDTWAHNRASIKGHHAAGFRTKERIVYFVKRLRR